jgi:serine/threonine protein phosphatase PrpC
MLTPLISSTSTIAANSINEDGCFRRSNGSQQLFGVIDGHGGNDVTILLEAVFPGLVLDELKACPKDPSAALTASYRKMDTALTDEKYEQQGASVVTLLQTEDTRAVVVASAGDCAAVAGVHWCEGAVHPRRLSGPPHTLLEPTELYKTIQALGVDSVQFDDDINDPAFRVDGLQSTRSLGDSLCKIEQRKMQQAFNKPKGKQSKKRKQEQAHEDYQVLNCEPYINTVALEHVAFIILCSDGVTEQLSDGQMVNIVAAHLAAGKSKESAADVLTAAAWAQAAFASGKFESPLELMEFPAEDLDDDDALVKRDYCDDMTAMVVFF